MDRCYMESRNRLYQDLPWLQVLLCGTPDRAFRATALLGDTTPSRPAWASIALEGPPTDFCQQHERSLSREGADRLHQSSVRYYALGNSPRIPGTYQTPGPPAGMATVRSLAFRNSSEHLARRVCRVRCLSLAS